MSDIETSNIPVWKEAADAAGSSAIGFILTLIYTILIVRALPQTEVGVFFFYLAIVFLVIQITKGIGAATRKRVSAINSPRDRSEYLWASVLLLVPILLLVLVGLYISAHAVSSHFSFTLTTEGITATMIAIVGVSIMELGRFHLAGSGEPGKAERYRVGVGKLGMTIITGLVLIFPVAEFALIARGLGYGVAGSIMLYLSPHQVSKPTAKKFREILAFSKWSIPTNVLNDFYHRWDTILLGAMVGAVSISYYDSSVRLATVGFPLMVGVSAAANVKLSGLYENGDEVTRIFENLLIVSTLCAYPILLVFFFSGELVLTWVFGPSYAPAAALLFLLGVQQVFQSFRLQFEALFNSFDTPKQTTKTSAIAVVLNIITAPLLVLEFGMLGVIYSTLLAEIARLLIYQYQAEQATGTIFFNKTMLLQPVILLCLGGLIKLVTVLVTLTPTQQFVLTIVGVGAFYLILYYTSLRTRKIITRIKKQVTDK